MKVAKMASSKKRLRSVSLSTNSDEKHAKLKTPCDVSNNKHISQNELFDCMLKGDNTSMVSFFQNLCLDLHIEDTGFISSFMNMNPFDIHSKHQKLIDQSGFSVFDEGLCHNKADENGINFTKILDSLAMGADALEKAGWPASFLLVFDEVWAILAQLEPVLSAASGGCECNMDLLCWCIRPGCSGFTPHRDRQPDDVANSFRSDGSPRYATCWLALDGAESTAGSCLYVIPKEIDPGYLNGDDEDGDPLHAALSDKTKFQYIRALPLQPGNAILFSHRLLHWGSMGELPLDDDSSATPSTSTNKSRVSFSFAASDPKFEAPYFDRKIINEKFTLLSKTKLSKINKNHNKSSHDDDHHPPPIVPSFTMRLALVCGQMIAYHERFQNPISLLRRMFAVFKKESDLFHVTYKEKISSEFLNAVRQAPLSSSSSSSSLSSTHMLSYEEDEGLAIDEALESVLENNVECIDDFDEEYSDDNDGLEGEYDDSEEEEEEEYFIGS